MKNAPKKKPVVKKPVPRKAKAKKPTPPPVNVGPFFTVEIEAVSNGVKVLRPHVAYADTDEQTAREGVESLKMIGVGGRLIKLNGTPEGELIEKWAGAAEIDQAKESEVAQQKA